MNEVIIKYFLETKHRHPYKVIYAKPEHISGSIYEYDRKTGNFEPGQSKDIMDMFYGRSDWDVEEVSKEIFDARVRELRDEIGVGEVEERLFNAEVRHLEDYDYSRPSSEQMFYDDDHR